MILRSLIAVLVTGWFAPALGLAGAPLAYGRCDIKSFDRGGEVGMSAFFQGWNSFSLWAERTAENVQQYVDLVDETPTWDTWAPNLQSILGTAFTNTPEESLIFTEDEGRCIGESLLLAGYETFHFTGHSSGAAIAAAAAKYVKRVRPESSVHLTLLAPYGPGLLGLDWGSSADWTDLYVSRSGLEISYFRWTVHPLPHAHTLEIQAVKPVLNLNHFWPRQFYEETTTNIWPEFEGYGFQLSQEFQGIATWSAANTHPVGESAVLARADDSAYKYQPATLFRQSLTMAAPNIVEQGPDPAVFSDLSLVLETDDSTWARLTFTIAEPVNSLTFHSLFQENDQGLAAMYLDNELLELIDGRFAPDDLDKHTLYFRSVSAGKHEIAFRLDTNAEDAISKISFSNLTTYFVDLRLPGDSNGDNAFDSSDLVAIFQEGEFEDGVMVNSDFEDGDWNNDGDFTTEDLVYVFQAGTYNDSSGLGSLGALVPEPAGLAWLLTAPLFWRQWRE